MTKKIIFLDIDSVLNYAFSPQKLIPENGSFDAFDAKLVANLKQILTAIPNSAIVISSSWCVSPIMEHISLDAPWTQVLEDMLGMHGCIQGQIGLENEFSKDPENGRALDIKCWLDKHPEVTDFVILDDMISEGGCAKLFPNNFVCCSRSGGLTGLSESQVKQAIWILTKSGREKPLDSKTFVISDTHFGHANIIRHCNRPWTDHSAFGPDGRLTSVSLEDVKQMDEDMISLWNGVVGEDDVVWHLGDFAFGKGKKERIPELVEKLNGKINLVLGNHDTFSYKYYLDAGFHRVYDHPVIIDSFAILSHEPLQWVQNQGVYVNLFGHVHNQAIYKHFTANSYNCCVEVNNYTPIAWDKIVADIASLREEK